jgi:hypothetical protein
MKRFLTLAAIALLLGACGPTPASPSPSGTAKQTFDSSMDRWAATLTPLFLGADNHNWVVSGESATAIFDDGEMTNWESVSVFPVGAAGHPVFGREGQAEAAICAVSTAGETATVFIGDALPGTNDPETLTVAVTPLSGTLFGLPAFGRSIAYFVFGGGAVVRQTEWCSELNGRILYYYQSPGGDVPDGADAGSALPDEIATQLFGPAAIPEQMSAAAPLLVDVQ